MADPFTPDEESSVSITLKAGKGYEAPWITLKAPNVTEALRLFKNAGEDLSALLKQASGAGIAFMNEYDKRNNPDPSGSYGKPEEAKRPSANTGADPFVGTDGEDPFAKSPEPMLACEHGTRKLVTHNGKTGHVCPLPKGSPGRCETVFV